MFTRSYRQWLCYNQCDFEGRSFIYAWHHHRRKFDEPNTKHHTHKHNPHVMLPRISSCCVIKTSGKQLRATSWLSTAVRDARIKHTISFCFCFFRWHPVLLSCVTFATVQLNINSYWSVGVRIVAVTVTRVVSAVPSAVNWVSAQIQIVRYLPVNMICRMCVQYVSNTLKNCCSCRSTMVWRMQIFNWPSYWWVWLCGLSTFAFWASSVFVYLVTENKNKSLGLKLNKTVRVHALIYCRSVYTFYTHLFCVVYVFFYPLNTNVLLYTCITNECGVMYAIHSIQSIGSCKQHDTLW